MYAPIRKASSIMVEDAADSVLDQGPRAKADHTPDEAGTCDQRTRPRRPRAPSSRRRLQSSLIGFALLNHRKVSCDYTRGKCRSLLTEMVVWRVQAFRLRIPRKRLTKVDDINSLLCR